MTDFIDTKSGRRIAYNRASGTGPWIVFLGGFKSDMGGTKAVHLEGWARRAGRAYLRFDYSGHGESSGSFEDGSIGDWVEDSLAAIEALTDGPVILVGSSMGGWISLLVAARSDRIAGFVGIAAAPDFTEDSMWAGFDEVERAALERDGRLALPSDYDDPYVITRRLIEDGRDNLVLRRDPPKIGRVRLLQGGEDADVTRETALRLLDHMPGDVRLTFVKGADHSFSTPACMAMIEAAVEEISA
jgi:pimeloyl-ACP methyl ester carboxylesterase